MPVFQNSSFMTVGASSTAPFAISSIMCSCNAVHAFVCKVLCCLWHMVHRFTLRFLKESCTGEAFSGFRVVPSSLLQPLENCPRCHCPRSSSPGSRKTRTHFVRHSTSIRSPWRPARFTEFTKFVLARTLAHRKSDSITHSCIWPPPHIDKVSPRLLQRSTAIYHEEVMPSSLVNSNWFRALVRATYISVELKPPSFYFLPWYSA